ncbi:dual specificity protein phosphatase, putative [Entamoeba invadens IP1]|uniref:protein-tyrosine-phosphatase n=1 Tax=Entamoeba invadens IP1 TaxID=370355 RepID=A0A0A1UAF5_ENTIV|nr:dual specificity protein phosphatase, putative [Entamoeba invadens IP1]ELP91980.1 dual specificity protein phosphatase, putative [Entamoeba invadens IP1]|eukprot:XP_004258751.1 dual specificity protein phosphatase, putative [Entamoeba invadens IP1]
MDDEMVDLVSEVIPGELYLGTRYGAEYNAILRQYSIQSVLSLVIGEIEIPTFIKQKLQISIEDSSYENIEKHFEGCITFIEQNPKPVLVHCEMGVSRSASIVIAYLMKTQKKTLKESYDFVKAKRTWINPNNGFWCQLYHFAKSLNLLDDDSVKFLYSKFGEKGKKAFGSPSLQKDKEKEEKKETTLDEMKTFLQKFDKAGFLWGKFFISY